jgi:hypothetical protein
MERYDAKKPVGKDREDRIQERRGREMAHLSLQRQKRARKRGQGTAESRQGCVVVAILDSGQGLILGHLGEPFRATSVAVEAIPLCCDTALLRQQLANQPWPDDVIYQNPNPPGFT